MFSTKLYKKILSSERKDDLSSYHQYASNNAIRDSLLHIALENENKDTLDFLTNNFTFDYSDIIKFSKYRQYHYVFILLKKLKKIEEKFVNDLISSFYQNFYFYGVDTLENMEGLQKSILLIFNQSNIRIYTSKTFCEKLTSLYNSRVKKSKRIIFEAALKVVCNPRHPVGYRLISKEYNELMKEDDRINTYA
jgi:hypothetical protein